MGRQRACHSGGGGQFMTDHLLEQTTIRRVPGPPAFIRSSSEPTDEEENMAEFADYVESLEAQIERLKAIVAELILRNQQLRRALIP